MFIELMFVLGKTFGFSFQNIVCRIAFESLFVRFVYYVMAYGKIIWYMVTQNPKNPVDFCSVQLFLLLLVYGRMLCVPQPLNGVEIVLR